MTKRRAKNSWSQGDRGRLRVSVIKLDKAKQQEYCLCNVLFLFLELVF